MQSPQPQLRYIIIDDDEIDRAVVESEANKFSFLQKIASCSNPLDAIEIINEGNPDIIFLDIEMPGLTGIEFLRKKIITTALPVLITSHPEFALEGFELEAFDYLLKPISSERFSVCAFRLRDFYQMRAKACAFDAEQETNFIIIKQGYDKYKIAMNDILYFEAMKDYTRISTVDKQFLMLSTLNGIIEKLPPGKFVRIHRSYVVNKSRVEAVQKNKVTIHSHELPIGKLYKHALSFPD
ncbi:MAG: LytTR family DNA-binding domain-containing protein [Bacteroidota bacterium]|nr:LytTR family DNA-binding domain-containing protein [Bacteroidota bacterium]